MSNSVVTQPERDQYWQHKESGDRAYFIGRTPEGEMVWQCRGDSVEVGNLDWSGWEYLPDCDSWDWEPVPCVPEYPQYWTTVDTCVSPDSIAYVIRNGPQCFGDHVYVDCSGNHHRSLHIHWSTHGRTQITKEQAEAMEIHKPKPVVAEPVKAPSDIMGQSPDDWVTQDRVPMRASDQMQWSSWPPNSWTTAGERITRKYQGKAMHGWVDPDDGLTLYVRCRRKDLPVVNPRISVTLYWHDGNIVGRYADSPVTDPSFVPIHLDSNGLWFIERSDNAGN